MDILISIAAKVCEYTVAPVGRQLGYLFFYKRNVEDLKTKIVDLGHVKARLQHEVEEAQNNARGIEADVNDWLAKADKVITEDQGNLTRDEEQANTKCICGAKFPNLLLRHRLSRRAKKMTETVATQIQDGNAFKQVSYRLNLPISVGNKGYEVFESRNRTLTDVMEALRDPSVGMVGVWGMGGVGKTMLAKEVARRAKDEEKLFTMAVFTAISKDQNIEKIQQEIGEKLGMQFHEVNKDVRAERLRNRLRQEDNLLIIIDDIWDKLYLEDVGISFGRDQKGCKILLTTRSYHVLANDMSVDTNVIFNVGDLLEHEAMSLFQKLLGNQAERHDNFQALASEIVKECGGLPIAITTVASALKNKGFAVWKNALQELRKSNPINIDGMHEKVYTSIKFSYDHLRSVEAKHLLLLCSLFPEDARIEIRVLCDYGFGLNLFEGVNTLEEARNKTEALVTNLKDHSLLLDADSSYLGYECVKLHDVIRDVVTFIASKLDDHHRMHNIRNADELENYLNKKMFKDSTEISLYGIQADQYPQRLKSPMLNLLRLVPSYGGMDSEELPHQLFEGLDKLLVLDSERTSFKLLPATSSFCLLPNLQTLRLSGCILGDINWIGELKSLKILDLSLNSSITVLPRGIGKLNRLMSLSLEECINLKVIEPNVISSLTRLEELNFENSFTNWEVEGLANANDERRNANLGEVKKLRRLIDFHLVVPNINSLSKDIFSEKLERYYIRIGDGKFNQWKFIDVMKTASRMLKLKLCPNNILNEHDFAALLGRSDVLFLNGLKIAKSVAFEIDRMGFQRLKHLTIEESTEIRYIVNWNNGNMDCLPAAFPSLESLDLGSMMKLENIIHKKLTTETSFGKLRHIEVSNCDKLKSLFSLFNIPKQLERIEVEDCTMMEEIISHDGKEGDHVVEKMEISQLQRLRLSRLPKVVQFIATSKSDEIKCEGQQSIDAPLFNGQIVFPKLDLLHISSLNIRKIWNDGQLPSSRFGFQNLTKISVWDCDHLKSLIPSHMIASLVHLRHLEVFCCKAVKEIVVIEESAQVMGTYVSFPKLECLLLHNLPNLERFCGGDISFPELKSLHLNDLQNLKRFCEGDILFPKLESLLLNGFPNLERFCGGDILFLKLEFLQLSNLPNLERLCGGDISFPELKYLFQLDGLPNLERFCGGDISFSKLKSLQLDGLPNLKRFCGGDILFPKLESLQLYGLPNLKRFCGGDIALSKLESLQLDGLPNLERFCGKDCVDCPSLSKLNIRGCKKLKVFITNTVPTITIEKEDKISMGSVADKEHLSHHKDVAKVDQLSTESSCSEITYQPHPLGFVEEHDEYLVFKTKCLSELKLWDFPNQQQLHKTFPTVELLSICDWGNRLKDLATPLMSFQNLKVLTVKDCHGLTSLFSPSTAKSLTQRLTELCISGCKSLRQVIANDDDDNTNIIFSKMMCLVLDDLSNLTSFYSGNNNVVLQFPRLAQLLVGCCPEMKTFCHGNIHCPSLHYITIGKWPEIKDVMWNYEKNYEMHMLGDSCWKGDINTTIQKLWEDENIRDSPLETEESEENVDSAEEDEVVGP